jgi:single-strand DNA-binding protein
MASFNKVFLMGNLTRDPQLKYLPNQTAVVEFGIACNRRWKGPNGEDREEVTFVDCASFGKQAEVINQYFQKGKPIFIEGRLKFDSWEDKQGGGKRSKLSVVIEAFQFIGDRQGGGGQGGDQDAQGGDEGGYQQRPPQRAPQQQRPSRPAPQRPPAEAPFSEEQQFKDDDIPF